MTTRQPAHLQGDVSDTLRQNTSISTVTSSESPWYGWAHHAYRPKTLIKPAQQRFVDYLLLIVLAMLWGSSYLFIKIAVAEIPPLTLISARVAIASTILYQLMRLRNLSFPRGRGIWRKLLIQSFFSSIGAWTVLAWGQQFIDSGLASVLNSTAPIFVFFVTLIVTRHESATTLKLIGACIGLAGVLVVVGIDVLAGLGRQVAGQLAALTGAALYAGAAIHGRHFSHMPPVSTAASTMLVATVVLVPLALILDLPWELRPTVTALGATLILGTLCTGLALLIYFRLVKSLGSLGVASQAYLRAGIGVLLGILFLDETISLPVVLGLGAAIAGVIAINWRPA